MPTPEERDQLDGPFVAAGEKPAYSETRVEDVSKVLTEIQKVSDQNGRLILYGKLENWFKYHAPTPEQVIQYQKIRDAAKVFAQVVIACTPVCADQAAAVRHVRDAVMTANASIACGGK